MTSATSATQGWARARREDGEGQEGDIKIGELNDQGRTTHCSFNDSLERYNKHTRQHKTDRRQGHHESHKELWHEKKGKNRQINKIYKMMCVSRRKTHGGKNISTDWELRILCSNTVKAFWLQANGISKKHLFYFILFF